MSVFFCIIIHPVIDLFYFQKLMEFIIKDHILNHLSSNNLLFLISWIFFNLIENKKWYLMAKGLHYSNC